MSITSPAEFLKDLDLEFFKRYRPLPDLNLAPIEYVEPDLSSNPVQTQTSMTELSQMKDAGDEPLRKLGKITSNPQTRLIGLSLRTGPASAITLSPGANPVTRGPTSRTIPETSRPRIPGNSTGNRSFATPLRIL